MTLYTYTGIRRSECVNLRLDQINLIAKEIYVVGKGDKQRTVYRVYEHWVENNFGNRFSLDTYGVKWLAFSNK